MIYVNVRGSAGNVIASLSALSSGLQDQAIVRALNRAIDASQTEASRRIRERYNLKARVVAGAKKKLRATKSQASARAELVVTGMRIPLVDFDARQLKSGALTVKVLNERGRKVVLGHRAGGGRPFVQVMKSGHRGVFQRTGKRRLPIVELYGPGIPTAFLQRTVLDSVKKVSRDVFEKTVEQQVKYLAERKG